MDKIKEIADRADMIVNGYAFTREDNKIRIVNLDHLDKELVVSENGKVLKNSMNDEAVRIALNYWKNNRRFMEDDDV